MDSKQPTTDQKPSADITDAVDSKFECCGAADDIHERLNHGHDRMDRIEESLSATRKDIAEVLEIIMLGKSFFKVASYIGTFVRWSAGLGATAITIWMAVRGNNMR